MWTEEHMGLLLTVLAATDAEAAQLKPVSSVPPHTETLNIAAYQVAVLVSRKKPIPPVSHTGGAAAPATATANPSCRLTHC